MKDTKNMSDKMFVICMYNNDIYRDVVYCELRIFSGHKFD